MDMNMDLDDLYMQVLKVKGVPTPTIQPHGVHIGQPSSHLLFFSHGEYRAQQLREGGVSRIRDRGQHCGCCYDIK